MLVIHQQCSQSTQGISGPHQDGGYISVVPEVITDGAPQAIDTHFHLPYSLRVASPK